MQTGILANLCNMYINSSLDDTMIFNKRLICLLKIVVNNRG